MANLQDFRRETGVPLAACVSTAIWFIYPTLCGRTRTDRCRVIKAAWTHVCTENINVKNCLYSNYTAVHRAAGFRATHAENQPGFSASRAAGAKSGARNPVRYEEPWETWYTVDSRPSQREGIKTQTMSGENEKKKKKTEHENLGEICRGRGGEGARSRSARLHGTVNPSGVCKEAERRGAHRRGGETLTHWLICFQQILPFTHIPNVSVAFLHAFTLMHNIPLLLLLLYY